MKRKIENQLVEWKHNHDKRCLLVKGARQVGKTYSIDRFARENYKHYTYLNFDENPTYKTIFDGDLDAETLIKQISLRVPDAELEQGETILFLDEIQNCPRARTALKFLAIDGRFDVVASGSMLGIHYKDVPSYPVGYVDHLDMYSMDFEEFLWANGVKETSIQDVREYFEKKEALPEAMHEKMMELFREYIVIGGMPRVVREFVETHHFAKVLSIQKGILSDYMDDIAKYAEGADKAKARACFLSIPKHLAKDYKKFRYSLVEPRATYRKYGGSLMCLYDAGIINFCYNLSDPALPLAGNARSDVFKVYMRDTGLLVAMLDEGSVEDIIDGNLGIYKGAIYENIIADIFAKSGKKLYYYEKNSKVEMDFFIRYQKTATAVEVKSAEKATSKSMTSMIQNYGVRHGIKLTAGNVSGNETVESLPLYMAMFL
ncbi:MAG: AAA family ATPase [Lachnospiraceae bacterium]|nr:AAA family ATPase [Lachnospiraceae bacterium]